MSEQYTLARIGRLVEEKRVPWTEEYIIYMFKLWYRKQGIEPLERPTIHDLQPDLVVKRDDDPEIVIEVVEPGLDIEDERRREIFEKFVLRVYADLIKPKVLVLTNGRSIFVYDGNLNLLAHRLLASLSENDEEHLKQLLLPR